MAKPKTFTTEEVLTAMRMGVDYTFTIGVRHFSFKVRLLSCAEAIRVAADVEADIKALRDDSARDFKAAMLQAMHTLTAAAKPFGDEDKIAPPVTMKTFERMTPDEVLFLLRQYQDGIARLNPAVEELTVDDLMQLVDYVKKNRAIPTGLSPTHLGSIVLFLTTNADTPEGRSSGG